MASTRQSFAKLVVLVALMIVAGFAPALIMAQLGWRGGANVAVLVGMAVFMACLGGNGWRTGLTIAMPFAVFAGLAQWAAPNPWLAAIVLALAAFLRGYAAKIGMHDALVMTVISLGFLVSTPITADATETPLPLAIYVVIVALVTALWATFVMYLLRHHLHVPAHTGLNRIRVRAYSTVLALLVGVATWLVVDLDLGHAGAWIILTILVVFQPSLGAGFAKAAHRVTGTVAGFLIAMGIGAILPSGPGIAMIGTLFLLVAFMFMLQGRAYWLFAAALTVAIVLLESSGSNVDSVAEERLVATLIGVAGTAVVMLVLVPVGKYLTARSATSATT